MLHGKYIEMIEQFQIKMKRNESHVRVEAEFQIGIARHKINFAGAHRQMPAGGVVVDEIFSAAGRDNQEHPVERMTVASGKTERYLCRFNDFNSQMLTEVFQVMSVKSCHKSIN